MFSRADHGLERGERVAVDGRRRVVIAAVPPHVDNGRHAVKRVLGDVLDVEADLLIDGHDLLSGVVRYRHDDSDGEWHEQPLAPLPSDRWHASIPLSALGRWSYTIEAWVDDWA